MADSFKSLATLASKVVELPDKCTVCGTNLIQVGKLDPACPDCAKRNKAERDKAVEASYFTDKFKHLTTDVLARDSIIEDKQLKQAEFSNYVCDDNTEAKDNAKLAYKLAIAYSKNDSNFNTVLSGSPGRGKSHLALSMLKYINENSTTPVSCLFVDIADMISRIKNTFNYHDDNAKYSKEKMIELCGNADYLVLDDLGSESTFQMNDKEATNFSQEVLFQIMQRRTNKSTIITTNLTSNQMGAIYNGKIISRLFTNVDGHIIKFTEKTPDNRRKVSF